MDRITKIKTGVGGLDSMLLGGIPENRQILIAGGPGVGKTLLSFEILYNCAKSGLPSVYISFEEDPADILKNARAAFSEFSDMDSLMEKGMLSIRGKELLRVLLDTGKDANTTIDKMAVGIAKIIDSSKAKIVCIDSISLLKLSLARELEYRKALLRLIIDLRRAGVTSIIISDTKSSERSKLLFEQEYFIFDGIIVLYDISEKRRRELCMEVVKMRGTKHSRVLTPYDITSHGVMIHSTR